MNEALEGALRCLPHGPEFRFVDRMLQLTPGGHGRAEYRVRGDESFLRGHFPGEPLFPGVLLVEAAAQVGGIVAQSDPARAPLRGLRLTAIRGAKILGTAGPGELLEIEASVLGRMEGLVQCRAEVRAAGRLLLQCEVVLSGTP